MHKAMKRQIKSFKNAFKGIAAAFMTESHLRFHFVAAYFVFLFAYISEMAATEWAILIITVTLVFSAELINTALEEVCNLYSKEYHPLIGKIKDISAGAVLITALGAIGVALWIFVFSGNLMYGLQRLFKHPVFLIPLGISAVCSVLFVIFGGIKNTKK